MSNRIYYCLCEDNCKFETMTKEQILATIAQAAQGGLEFDPNAAFITKVRESNRGGYITFWIGTQAQYNALAVKAENCLYIITDNDAPERLDEALLAAQEAVEKAAQAKALATAPKMPEAIGVFYSMESLEAAIIVEVNKLTIGTLGQYAVIMDFDPYCPALVTVYTSNNMTESVNYAFVKIEFNGGAYFKTFFNESYGGEWYSNEDWTLHRWDENAGTEAYYSWVNYPLQAGETITNTWFLEETTNKRPFISVYFGNDADYNHDGVILSAGVPTSQIIDGEMKWSVDITIKNTSNQYREPQVYVAELKTV